MDIARVSRVDRKYAYIFMKLNGGCGSCTSKAVCFSGEKPIALKIKNDLGLKKDDLVEIELSSNTKMSAGFLLFMFPLIMLIIGYFLGSMIDEKEIYGISGAMTSFIISLVLLKIFNKYAEQNNVFKPVHLKKVGTALKMDQQ